MARNRDHINKMKEKHKAKFPFKSFEEVIEDEKQSQYDKKEYDLPEKHDNIKKIGSSGVSIFGADMNLDAKRKLEARQHLNLKNRSPNESIQSRYSDGGSNNTFELDDSSLGINLQFDGQSDFSSRTPVARMWTAVQLQTYTERRHWHKTQEEDYKRDETKYNYIVKGSKVSERTVNKHDRIIYVVGNHTMNELKGQPNEPRTGESIGSVGGLILPEISESNQNEFFMPPAGITGVSMETEGALGLIKKTSVKFKVNNHHDFESIFQRYFLRPGAQVFVDFGWSTIPLYDPKTIAYDDYKDGKELDEILYGTDGIVTRAAGDMEVLQGFVTEFKSNVQRDGTYECELEMVSKNNSLMEANFLQGDEGEKKRLLATIDAVILNFAAKHFGVDMLGQNKIYDYTSAQMQSEILYTFGKEKLQSKAVSGKNPNIKIPASKEVLLTGVYWQTNYATPEDDPETDEDESKGNLEETPADSKNIYIMWGLFEDLILNEQFGFGRNKKDVLFGNDVSIRFDSSHSYVSYEPKLELSTFMAKAEAFDFRYPETWDKTYNTYRNKVNIKRLDSKGKYKPKPDHKDFKTWTALDKHLKRVPLREMFINLSVIKDAIEKKNGVKDVMKAVLDKLKEASSDIWDLQLGSPRRDGSLVAAMDRNFVQAERDDLGGTSYLDRLFMFKPNSPDSIVKDMSLEFAMPSGDMGNMIAIQSGGGGNAVFATNKSVDRVLATSIFQEIGAGLDSQYLPTMGNYPMQKFTAKISDGYVMDSLKNDEDIIFAGDSETSDAILSQFGGASSPSSYKKKTKTRMGKDAWNELVVQGLSEEEARLLEAAGEITEDDLAKRKENREKVEIKESDYLHDTDQLAASLEQYYKLLAKSSYFFLNTSSILPININLTIDGISSLNVGNLFKVDYLPKMYRETVYFQITNIKHEIASDGWKTDLEAVMRIAPVAKKAAGIYAESTNIYLSRKALTDGIDINVVNKNSFSSGTGEDTILFPFISRMVVLGTGSEFNLGFTDYIMSFEAITDYTVFRGDFKTGLTTSNDPDVKWGVRKGYIHWGFPWGKDAGYSDTEWAHDVDFYCGRYKNFFITGLQDAKTSKVERAGWDFYYNYWTCNIEKGHKYIVQISRNNNMVIYPYPTVNDGLSDKDFEMLSQHIDGIFHMYSGFYTKARNYRPKSWIWNRLKKTQKYFDQKTTGWYEGGSKPRWVNNTSFYIRSYANTKYRFESD